MNGCSVKTLTITDKFIDKLEKNPQEAKNITNEFIGSLRKLMHGQTAGNPETIAEALYGMISVDITDRGDFFDFETTEEMQEFVEEYKLEDHFIQETLDLLGPEYNSKEGVKKLIKDSIRHNTQVGSGVNSMSSSTEEIEVTENLVEHNLSNKEMVHKSLSLTAAQSNLMTKKAERITLVKGLKPDSPDMWASFLQVYFPGASNLGEEFTKWSKEKFYELFLDTSDSLIGFVTDIDAEVNDLKNEVAYHVEDTEGIPYGKSAIEFKANMEADETMEGARRRYFYNILNTDFDFILENIIKVVTLDERKTFDNNHSVENMVGLGENLEPMLLDISNPKVFKLFDPIADTKNRFEPKVGVDNEVVSIEMNSVQFLKDETKQKGKFYELLGDGNVYYRTYEGENILLNKQSFYRYNSSSKRNTSSIDHYVNPLDNASKFINNLFPLFNLLGSDGVPGRPMSVADFIALAPLTLEMGKDLDAFEKGLADLANSDATKIATIARTLHAYVFSKNPTWGIHSIRLSARDGEGTSSLNHDIVNALHSALISKEHVQYIRFEENRTIKTKGPNEGTESQVIDDELSGYLVDGRYTIPTLAKKLDVHNNTIDIILPNKKKVNIQDITTLEAEGSSVGMRAVSMELGLEMLYNQIVATYTNIYTQAEKDNMVLATFKSIIEVAASNKKKNRLVLSSGVEKDVENVEIHQDYMYVSPSTLIKDREQKNLAEVFFVDSSKAQRIGGITTQSSTTPNKNTSIKGQVKVFNQYNTEVNEVKMGHNPFLMEEGVESNIIPAEVGETVIKAPIVFDGEVIKLSDWDTKTRLEFAMVQGFLEGPKNPGQEFFIQVVNYSDKSSPELNRIMLKGEENLLAPGKKVEDKLRKAYIQYNLEKNIALQKVSITSLRDYIVGNFEKVYSTLGGDTEREQALIDLKYKLMYDPFTSASESSDITRPINDLLKIVKLTSSSIQNSNANMDYDADYFSFRGGEDVAYLKPTAGIRAEAFRTKGDSIVDQYLKKSEELLTVKPKNNTSLENLVVDKKRIEKILRRNKNITSNVKEFYRRFFLINGIYGHGLKTLTMGDESYFSGKFKAIKGAERSLAIDNYYTKAYSDLADTETITTAGLNESVAMLTGQFKRAQSILSRGVLYTQKRTLPGIKRASNKRNLLQYLDIYKGRTDKGEDVYRFKELEGKTLSELQGLGVIEPIDPEGHDLYHMNDNDMIIRFNIGKDSVLFSTDLRKMQSLVGTEYPMELFVAIQDLLDNHLSIQDNSEGNKETGQHIPSSFIGTDIEPDIVQVRDHGLTMNTIYDLEEEIKSSGKDAVAMPDLIPSILISDPESHINLLNRMDVRQENSDAIQYIHPLLSLIRQHARGNSIGAFNTENHEAGKFLITTVEYDKHRQVLQKSSTQMPFTVEQIRKLGSVELFNMLKKLNTAIDFKKPYMTYYVIDKKGNRVLDKRVSGKRIDNLDQLFTALGGYGEKGDKAWEYVLDVLKQNPENMYSFVGLINVPSNQKTGQKKINKFENTFSRHRKNIKPDQTRTEDGRNFVETEDLLIDYTANEFAFEILTKAHDWDVSGRLNKRSSLSLLSQLVNAVSFGGLSNVTASSLQNAMGSRMDLNRLRVGKDFAIVARDLGTERGGNQADYVVVADRLNTGDVSTEGYTDIQMEIYAKTIRRGVYSIAQLAFKESSDSLLLKKMIEGEGYSLDTPAVQNKVMGTLRAAFFGDTVKQRMEGFQAVVSATHKVVNMFDINGARKSRSGYIEAALDLPYDYNWEENNEQGRIISLNSATAEDVKLIQDFVLPFDMVKVVTTITPYSKNGEQLPDIYEEKLVPRNKVRLSTYLNKGPRRVENEETNDFMYITENAYIVITPDVLYTPEIETREKFDSIDRNAYIRVNSDGKTYYKWYVEEKFSSAEIDNLIETNDIIEDITEKYSLKWYGYSRELENGTIEDLKDTAEYKDYYRATIEGKIKTERDAERYRANLIAQTQTIIDGEQKWKVSLPEVVLPNFVRERYNLPKGVDLNYMIGNSSSMEEQLKHVEDRLRTLIPRGNRFALLTHNVSQKTGEMKKKQKHYSKMITRIYASKALKNPSQWHSNILTYLETTEAEYIKRVAAEKGINEHDVLLSNAAMAYINEQKTEAYEDHLKRLAKSFMDMLEVTLTRIPGQSKQSGFTARVVEFLDAQGNASFASTDHLVNTGGDLDIDTLSVLTKTLDAEGMMYDDSSFRDSDGVYQASLLTKEYDKDIKAVEDGIKEYLATSNKEAQDYVARLEEKIAAQTDPAMIASLEERKTHAQKNILDEARAIELKDKLIKNVHKKYENILSNIVAKSVIDSLKDVNTSVEVNTPISMSMFPPIIKRLEEEHGTAELFGMSGETYWPVFRFEELAAQGKEAIGVYATVLKVNSAIQSAYMEYKKRGETHIGTDNPFVFDHKISFQRKVNIRNEAEIAETKHLLIGAQHEGIRLEQRLEEAQLKQDITAEENPMLFIFENMPKMSSESLKKETGLRGGVTGDIGTAYLGRKGVGTTVDGAAHKVWELMPESMKNAGWDTSTIKDVILDFVVTPYAENKNKLTGKADIPIINKEIAENTEKQIALEERIKNLESQSGTKLKKVTRSRTTFSDIDRFNIMDNLKKSESLQKSLNDLKAKSDKYEEEALPTLVNMLQDEMSERMTKYLQVPSTFTYDQKQALLQQFSVSDEGKEFDEPFVIALLNELNVKGVIDPEILRRLEVATGIPVGTKKGFDDIKARLQNSLIDNSANTRAVFNDIAKDLFGLTLPENIANSSMPIKNFKDYLTANPELVERAFNTIVGKQLSNDVQSQFLSAATDNAKELYLGKIRSSSLTNSVITTMMVLGYDIDDIIDFLYDPTITKILLHFTGEKSGLKRVSMNAAALKNLKGVTNDAAKQSLVSILEISDAITRFRDVRSLNENAKIDPAILDKIMQNINGDVLYKAIIDDRTKEEVNGLTALSMGENTPEAYKVFNPVQMTFLHPQSKSLYINLYESEKYKMRALFNSVLELTTQAGKKGRNTLTYKSISNNLAALKVEAFLRTPVAKQNEDGTITEEYRLGTIIKQRDDGTFIMVGKKRLDTPFKREEFIDNFPTFLAYARQALGKNSGLDNLGYTNTFKSSKSVIGYPRLSGSNVDPVDIALVQDGIRELQTPVPVSATSQADEQARQSAINKLKQEVYNNLSYYALIVSSGEVKKGSMIDMFEKVNYELAEFLDTLDAKYYEDNFRPKDGLVQKIINDQVDTVEKLKQLYGSRNSGYRPGEEDGMDFMEMSDTDVQGNEGQDRESFEEIDFYGEQGGGKSYTENPKLAVSKVSQKPVLGNSYTSNNVYRFIDPFLKNQIFYSHAKGQIAYRIFDIVSNESLPQTVETNIASLTDVPDTFLADLNKAGKQIGYRTTFDDQPAWILGYAGRGTVPGEDGNADVRFDSYIVYLKSTESVVELPGIFLMEKNDDLFLKGNIIEPRSSRNRRRYDHYKEQGDRIAHMIPKDYTIKEYNFEVNEVASLMFSPEELRKDPIISTEAHLVVNFAGSVIKMENLDDAKGTDSLRAYSAISDEDFPKASQFSRSVLVPAVKLPRKKSKQTELKAVIPIMEKAIVDVINNLGTEEEATFYGIIESAAMDSDLDFRTQGGITTIENLLSPYLDNVEEGETVTMFDGAFEITRVAHKANDTYEYRIKRVESESTKFLIPVNGKIVEATVDRGKYITPQGPNASKYTKHVKRAAIDMGYLKVPHKKITRNINGNQREIIVTQSNDSDRKYDYIIKVPSTLSTSYYSIKPKGEYKGGFNNSSMIFSMSSKEIEKLNKKMDKDTSRTINETCN